MTETAQDAPQFANPAALFKVVPLAFPVTFKGRTYAAVYLRRLGMRDLKAAVERAEEARKTNPDANTRLPIYFAEDGTPFPDEVLDALEVDDFDTVDEAAAAFLPRRFRMATSEPTSTDSSPSAPTPASGDTTAPSSSA